MFCVFKDRERRDVFTLYKIIAIVFMNNLTRYSVVLYRPKAKDNKNIDKLFKDGGIIIESTAAEPKSLLLIFLQNFFKIKSFVYISIVVLYERTLLGG